MTSIILLAEYTITSLVSCKQWREFQICGWSTPPLEVKRRGVKLALTLQSRLWKIGKLYNLILEVEKTIYLCFLYPTYTCAISKAYQKTVTLELNNAD